MKQKEIPTKNIHTLPVNPNHSQGARNIKDGDWYWIHKSVIQKYASKIGVYGIAVYNMLASYADKNQRCFPSQKKIAKMIQCSRAVVNKTVKLLENQRLITIERRSRYHSVYRLLKVSTREPQVSTAVTSDVSEVDTNKNKVTRINNNKVVGIKKNDFSFKPGTREELLALDIATAFSDFENIPRYVLLAKQYPESFLRQMLSETKEIPDNKIKKSRSAIFNYFLQKHVYQNNHYPGNQSRN